MAGGDTDLNVLLLGDLSGAVLGLFFLVLICVFSNLFFKNSKNATIAYIKFTAVSSLRLRFMTTAFILLCTNNDYREDYQLIKTLTSQHLYHSS